VEQPLNTTAGSPVTLEMSVAVYADGLDHATAGPSNETPQGTLSIDDSKYVPAANVAVLPLPHEFNIDWIVDSLAPGEMAHVEACA
jgi:hypothetical protein